MKKVLRYTLFLIVVMVLGVEVVFGVEGIYVQTFSSEAWYLHIEILDDDLVHFQYSDEADTPFITTPMVAKSDYLGPSSVTNMEMGVIETPDLRLTIQPDTLCITLYDLVLNQVLTTICPLFEGGTYGFLMSQESITDIYGLGEQFPRHMSTDGNWIGNRRTASNPYGNELAPFSGGNVGNAQFPIMYALGDANLNYAFFFDDIYQQYWDFSTDPFSVSTKNDVLRGYLMTGTDLVDLRRDYMELTGHAPVPPKKMFGLWVSEYGYDNWDELMWVLESLREEEFPVDGFVLDLQWFGGIGPNSQMGSLSWDERSFSNPSEMIEELRDDYGLGIMVIEEPFVSERVEDYNDLLTQGILVRECMEVTCEPIDMESWWGSGSMVDWTDPSASAWWHDNRRQHLIDVGVIGHWTDLGEPEDFDKDAWYYGFPELNRHRHADIHNIYNLLWSKSIWDGYKRNGVVQRPFIMSRSGTSGSQRYGVSMWSGDIATNMASLEGQMNVQMHMSLSGIDYFGSDVGGFYRHIFDPKYDQDMMYTLWMANSALLDIPLRPHAFNVQDVYETAPSLIGDIPSNLANVRLRYELIPYMYTYAHHAYRYGDALVAPLVYHFQKDQETRKLGSHKMIGDKLLMVTLTGDITETRAVYLPEGIWFDYHTNESIISAGEWIEVVSLDDELLQAPLFVRDGAIIPTSSLEDELVIKIFQSQSTEGHFTLIEDDGATTAYTDNQVRETSIGFVVDNEEVTITIDPVVGTYKDAPKRRNLQIKLVSERRIPQELWLNDELLHQINSSESADSGWLIVDNNGELVIVLNQVDVFMPTTIRIAY